MSKSKILPSTSLEGIEEAEAWEMIKMHLPQTAPLLYELDELINNAQSLVQNLKITVSDQNIALKAMKPSLATLSSQAIDHNLGQNHKKSMNTLSTVPKASHESLKKWEKFENEKSLPRLSSLRSSHSFHEISVRKLTDPDLTAKNVYSNLKCEDKSRINLSKSSFDNILLSSRASVEKNVALASASPRLFQDVDKSIVNQVNKSPRIAPNSSIPIRISTSTVAASNENSACVASKKPSGIPKRSPRSGSTINKLPRGPGIPKL